MKLSLWIRFTLLALVLITVALISALTAMRFAIHGQEVAVPAVVGMLPSEAERHLTELGLQLTIERQYYSPGIAEGRIMSQLPLPGTKVRPGWQVRVAQSLGPIRVAIPDVTGQSRRAAELNVKRRGLELTSTAEVDMPAIPQEQVVAQNPPANASQVAAPKVSLLVAVPTEPQSFVMPNFVGQPLGSASRTLQDNGFRLGNVTVAAPPSITPADSSAPQPAAPPQATPASIIVSQNPAAGQRIVGGAAVNFEVR